MLESFGCLAYASTLKRDRSKLDPRAHPSVFLGYAQNQKVLQVVWYTIKNDVCIQRCFVLWEILSILI